MYTRKFSRNDSRSRFGNSRPFSGGGSRRPARRASYSQDINVSKFINKAVTIEQTAPFVPENLFSDLKIEDRLKANVLAKGFNTPTPIQDKVIPHILNGLDVVGIANTGTGKTGAFLIPLIQKVLTNKKEKVLIIAPTRELAIQIDQEFRSLGMNLKLFSVCCVGGAPIGRQISELRYHNDFIIGTPGRINDLIKRNFIKPGTFTSIVLDEADRMLDMGFIGDIKLIMSKMPKERHTLFFSATMSKEIEAIIGEFLREPVRISVKTGDTSKNIDQDVIRIAGGSKIDILQDLLKSDDFRKVIVFSKTKHGAEKLANTLVERGLKAESIHGDKNHAKRQKALSAFKNHSVRILVATDVAARGLDIPDVSHVINYDIPATYDDYVHRIGRTGRGDKKGKALTFVE